MPARAQVSFTNDEHSASHLDSAPTTPQFTPPMTDCRDDLVEVDLTNSAPGTIQSTSSSSTVSLFPLILLNQSHGLNLQLPDSLPRILRPLDTKDTVLTNPEVEELDNGGQQSGVWSGGCVDSQEDDDEVIVHVRFAELVRIK